MQIEQFFSKINKRNILILVLSFVNLLIKKLRTKFALIICTQTLGDQVGVIHILRLNVFMQLCYNIQIIDKEFLQRDLKHYT